MVLGVDRPRPLAYSKSMPENPSPTDRHAPLSFGGFVALVAALMALNALAIDIMLPGFPNIERSFHLSDPNYAQTVISAYLIGFGLGQLAMGVLSDRYGRRPVLLAGLVIYGAAAFFCAISPSMEALLIGRFVQGLGSAAPRVVAVAVVRDCYGGRQMARVMSLVFMVFMAVPVVAPSLGQGVLLFANWHMIFVLLFVYAVIVFWVCLRRLPETLHPEYRRPIEVKPILEALGSIFGARQTVGYMLSAGAFLAALFGFINSAQQVLGEVLGLGQWFPLVFAVVASGIALASFINSALVERFGMRLMGHGAVILFLVFSTAMLVLARLDLLTAHVFLPLLVCTMPLVGLIFANFNSIAMEPQQHVAGIASSMIGAVTILIGAGGGFLVGQAFDGTILPLAVGFSGFGALSLVLLLITERGKLCQPTPKNEREARS